MFLLLWRNTHICFTREITYYCNSEIFSLCLDNDLWLYVVEYKNSPNLVQLTERTPPPPRPLVSYLLMESWCCLEEVARGRRGGGDDRGGVLCYHWSWETMAVVVAVPIAVHLSGEPSNIYILDDYQKTGAARACVLWKPVNTKIVDSFSV